MSQSSKIRAPAKEWMDVFSADSIKIVHWTTFSFFLSRKMSFFGPLEKCVFRVGTFKNSICQFDSALNIIRFILEKQLVLPANNSDSTSTVSLWPLWTLDKFGWLFC